jgi:hypothetical protein
MAIEVKVSGKPQKVKRDYPYLGRHEEGIVVLFMCKNCGTCVDGDEYPVGHTSDGWNEDAFTPLSPSETITLRNK